MSLIGATFLHLPPFHIQTEIHICDAICKNLSDVTSQNAKLSFWSHFKAESELFLELFKFCLFDTHIQSYN